MPKRSSDRSRALSSSFIGVTRSWKTCLVKVRLRNSGVVVNLSRPTDGGTIQPSSSRKSAWLPSHGGIMSCSVQKIALLCRRM